MYLFEEPSYFWILLCMPILWVLIFYNYTWQQKTYLKYFNPSHQSILTPDQTKSNQFIIAGLLSVAIIVLAVALANPKTGTKLVNVKRAGVDIVFVLDVSKSMWATDVAPDRLEKSKQIIHKTIDQLGSDRVGMVVYAGSPYPLLPITTDFAAAKLFLQNAEPDLVSSQGTALKDALEHAASYFDHQSNTHKFLVLLTDGEDHEENVSDITDDLSDSNIQLIAVGVGTSNGSVIPNKVNGINKGNIKDQQGNIVISKRNETLLQEIVNDAEGLYVDGNDTMMAVQHINHQLNSVQKKNFESKQFSDAQSQYQWFVGLALIILMIDLVVFDKKTQWKQKINLLIKKQDVKN